MLTCVQFLLSQKSSKEFEVLEYLAFLDFNSKFLNLDFLGQIEVALLWGFILPPPTPLMANEVKMIQNNAFLSTECRSQSLLAGTPTDQLLFIIPIREKRD